MESKVFEFSQVKFEPTPVGERRAFITSPTATLDEFAVHMTTLNPGQWPHPPHQHPDEEMVLIKEGSLQITINGKTQQAGAGSVVFVAPGDMHGWQNVGDVPARYWVLRWTTAKTGGDAYNLRLPFERPARYDLLRADKPELILCQTRK